MKYLYFLIAAFAITACNYESATDEKQAIDSSASKVVNTSDSLPPPDATQSVQKMSKEIGWPNGKMPVVPKG